MDIARSLDRPQSSTSELMTSLAEMGLLHKDPITRIYTLSARAALIGTHCQPSVIRNGNVSQLVKDLSEATGLTIALAAPVMTDVQLIHWRPGSDGCKSAQKLANGMKEALYRNASGRLLLSTFPRERCQTLLHRLNAEADEKRKFRTELMMAEIDDIRHRQYAVGPAGFGTRLRAFSALIPRLPSTKPLCIVLFSERRQTLNADALMQMVAAAIERNLGDQSVHEFAASIFTGSHSGTRFTPHQAPCRNAAPLRPAAPSHLEEHYQ